MDLQTQRYQTAMFVKAAFAVLSICVIPYHCESQCGINVCLTWHTDSGRLILTCRVDKWNYTVSFRNPLSNLTAACSKHSCYGIDKHPDQTSNITSFTYSTKLTHDVNGYWRCNHGTNVHNASVKVTTSICPENNDAEVSSSWFDFDCTFLLTSWLNAGFIGTLGIFLLICVAKDAWESSGARSIVLQEGKRARPMKPKGKGRALNESVKENTEKNTNT